MIETLRACDIEVDEKADLKKYSTMHCRAKVGTVIFPKNDLQLKTAIKICKRFGCKYYILGNGSNVVFCDNSFVLIQLKYFNKIIINEDLITCGAGASLNFVCQKAKESELSGMEEFFGIPASVGGAIVMNARAFSKEIKDVVSEVKCLTASGKIAIFSKKQCDFAYKHSIFQNSDLIITQVTFKLMKGNVIDIVNKMENFMYRRLQTQPQGYSCGCVFKNGANFIAGKVIQECGFAGKKFKNFIVSDKHCNFILNKGNGTSKDLINLIEKIKEKVYNEKKIILEEEIIFIGGK